MSPPRAVVPAPVRRTVPGGPSAPHPPGRGRDHAVGRAGRVLTRWVRPLERTPLGGWLRRRLRRRCQLRPVPVTLGRGGAGLDGMRIAMLSDLHVGFFFDAAEFAELAARVGEQSPDLICLVGDLIDQELAELELLPKGLAALRAACETVVAVPGNHEYAAEPDLKRFCEVLERTGVEPLLNRGRRVSRGEDALWVAGVDDLTAGEPDLAAALAGAIEREPALLLAHHPDLFCEAAYAGVDLTLSGHTHAGQITWFGSPLLPGSHHTQLGYWQGHHQVEGAQLLVGRGVGTCLLPLRVAADPEVLLIELRTPRGNPGAGC